MDPCQPRALPGGSVCLPPQWDGLPVTVLARQAPAQTLGRHCTNVRVFAGTGPSTSSAPLRPTARSRLWAATQNYFKTPSLTCSIRETPTEDRESNHNAPQTISSYVPHSPL